MSDNLFYHNIVWNPLNNTILQYVVKTELKDENYNFLFLFCSDFGEFRGITELFCAYVELLASLSQTE